MQPTPKQPPFPMRGDNFTTIAQVEAVDYTAHQSRLLARLNELTNAASAIDGLTDPDDPK